MAEAAYCRHDLVRIAPAAWDAVLAAAPQVARLDGEARRLVGQWAERGYPLIVRRRGCADAAGGIAVGLPLPPSLGKQRIGLSVAEAMIETRVSAVPLDATLTTAPEDMRGQIAAVVAFAHGLDLRPAVFGALAWQHLTGLAYLRPGSDIDLLWRLPGEHVLPAFLAGLAELDVEGPARLDGEILLASGAGVNWRELNLERDRPNGLVLVKTLDEAELRCARTLPI